jgi:hypothetical protein
MDPQTYRALNRLLTILERSLPQYLSYASPWLRQNDSKGVEVLRRIVEDQQQLATRVADLVLEAGPIDMGEFPIEFLDMHDLAFDFLLLKLVEYQKQDVAAIERLATQLQPHRRAAALAEEALGAARGHLENLEELAADLAKSGPTWMIG